MVRALLIVADLVAAGPDADAFIGGLKVGMVVGLTLIFALAGVSLLRRLLG